ncbi:MAG TPA: hypothetical protein VLA41_04460 [Burkholderiales bacterium]|nr:hypothetical protein [Burkholderiales bacterium]
METLYGGGLGVFIGVTLCVMGFAAYMTGQAVANTWKPAWHAIAYALLLGCADRFLAYALFDGELLSPAGYVLDTAVLTAIALLAFRIAQARKMVQQYPWLYARSGPFSWREKSPSATGKH